MFGHQNRRFIKNHNEEPQRGQFIHKGYVYIKAPKGHPTPTQNRYIKRARLIMEQHIDRYLDSTEEVHHTNDIRNDDRIENLEILSKSEHNKKHRKAEAMLNGKKSK